MTSFYYFTCLPRREHISLVESEEFIFQEFVRPFKKRLSTKITELTGITKEKLEDARQMWEVIPEFMEFVGYDILVGYNCR